MMKGNKILIAMAAGSGTRMGSETPKQFLSLGGIPILRRMMETFIAAVPGIKVVTVLPNDYLSFWKEYCLSAEFTYPQTLVGGGFTRFHSVRNALERVPDGAIVAIHDGVRPMVSRDLVRNMFAEMEEKGLDALIPVVPSVDTLKILDRTSGPAGGTLVEPEGEEIDRSRVYAAQTPQMFRSEAIREAYSQPFDTAFTDDASVARKKGIPLSFCDGERYNFKITSPEDLALAELIVSSTCR